MNNTHLSHSSQTAPIKEFRVMWTQQKKQKLKKWHDGTLRFHTFNNRMLLYDEAQSLVADKYLKPGRRIDEGDEIDFEQHLVTVEEFLQTVVQDLTPMFAPALQRQMRAAQGGATSPVRTPLTSRMGSTTPGVRASAPTVLRPVYGGGPQPQTPVRPLQTPQSRFSAQPVSPAQRRPHALAVTPAPTNKISAPLAPLSNSRLHQALPPRLPPPQQPPQQHPPQRQSPLQRPPLVSVFRPPLQQPPARVLCSPAQQPPPPSAPPSAQAQALLPQPPSSPIRRPPPIQQPLPQQPPRQRQPQPEIQVRASPEPTSPPRRFHPTPRRRFSPPHLQKQNTLQNAPPRPQFQRPTPQPPPQQPPEKPQQTTTTPEPALLRLSNPHRKRSKLLAPHKSSLPPAPPAAPKSVPPAASPPRKRPRTSVPEIQDVEMPSDSNDSSDSFETLLAQQDPAAEASPEAEVKPLAQRQRERSGYEASGAWSREAEFLFDWRPPGIER